MNNRAPEYLRKEFKLNRELGLHRTWGYDKLHLKSVKTEWGRKSFGFQAAQDWNNLPEDIRAIRSVASYFQKTLETAISKLLLDNSFTMYLFIYFTNFLLLSSCLC